MAVWAALVAALVALTGFLVNGSLNRATEKRRTCADALSCVERYAQLPLTFSRRPDDDSATLSSLGATLGQVQVDMAFHKRWLELEDPASAKAYRDLCAKYERLNSGFRRDALAAPPVGVEVARDAFKGYDADAAWTECIRVMRAHVNRTRLMFWRA